MSYFAVLWQFGLDRSENLQPMEMAVNLLRCRRQELGGDNWKPKYRVVGDMVELTGVEVGIATLRTSMPLTVRSVVVM